MARQCPQLSPGLRVELVGGYLVWNLQPGRVAFLARIPVAVCPARHIVAFPAPAPRFTVTALRWPPAPRPVPAFPGTAGATARPRRRTPIPGDTPAVTITATPHIPGTSATGLVPAFPGTASVAALPRSRGTPARRRTPAVTITATPRASRTLTARPAATVGVAPLPRPPWMPTCLLGTAVAAVSVISPHRPEAPACGLRTAGPVPIGVTGPSRRTGAPARRPAATSLALASVAPAPCPARPLLFACPASVGGTALPPAPPASVSATVAPHGAGTLGCGLPAVRLAALSLTGLFRGAWATAGAWPGLPASIGATPSSYGAGTLASWRAAARSPLAGTEILASGPGTRAPGLGTTAPGPPSVTSPPRAPRPGA